MKRISILMLLFGFLTLPMFISTSRYGVSAKKQSGRIEGLVLPSMRAATPSTRQVAGLGEGVRIASRRTDDDCPLPMQCHNGFCCPKGYTLHCPHSTCEGVPDGLNGCYNPSRLSEENLAKLRNCCPELASCS
jgi:hypothetical protein